jgi:hypothetical protein
MFNKTVVYEGVRYKVVAPPKRESNEHKKYEVYDAKTGDYITAFGSKPHTHYFDKFGYYKHLNTLDKQQRKRFRDRHRKDRGVVEDNPQFAGWWAYRFLW